MASMRGKTNSKTLNEKRARTHAEEPARANNERNNACSSKHSATLTSLHHTVAKVSRYGHTKRARSRVCDKGYVAKLELKLHDQSKKEMQSQIIASIHVKKWNCPV